MMKGLFLLLSFLAVVPLVSARDFQICSSYGQEKVFVSYGYFLNQKWVAQGWFMVRSGRCLPFAAPIKGGQFYYFAYNEDQFIKYEGDKPFCVDSKPYRAEVEAPSVESCEDEGLQLRLFKSFDLNAESNQTRLILEPPKGPETDPVPYKEADIDQLNLWASEGDPNAQAELEERNTAAKSKAEIPQNAREDMQENDTQVEDDKGAFEVD